MKINMPVTEQEYKLTEADSIVSKTDLKGCITYINDDFLRISGFEESELIGASHNIVRHPDMPVEAFADLWNSLKANRPWTGIVKNRSKKGDNYWVQANVTPIYESGKCIGFMSVRCKPSEAQVKAASAAYALFKSGHADGLRIQDGKVVKSGLIAKLAVIRNTSIKTRLVAALAAMSIILLSLGALSFFGTVQDKHDFQTMYDGRVVPMEQVLGLQKSLLMSRETLSELMQSPADSSKQKKLASLEESLKDINKSAAVYATLKLTPDEAKLVGMINKNEQQLVQDGFSPMIAALQGNDTELAGKLMSAQVLPLYQQIENNIDELIKLQTAAIQSNFRQSMNDLSHQQQLAFWLIVIGILQAVWAMTIVLRGVINPIKAASELLQQIAQGNYSNDITIKRQDEVGRLLDTIKAMQITLGFRVADEGRIASENLRIRIGLDNVSTGVVIADTDFDIIYMNKAAEKLMAEVESDFRKDLPGFTASKLKGSSIDAFHKKPEHQRALLEKLEHTVHARILLGGHSFALATSPVISKEGIRLGTALEWNEKTTEVEVENEVAAIVAAAAKGDFGQRINMQGKEGFFKQLGSDINELMRTSEQGLEEIARMLNSLANGDLTDRIETEYSGTFGKLKDDANITCDKLKEIVWQIKMATDTIDTAAHEIAAGNTALSQRTEEQAASLEETAASMEEFSSIVRHNSDNAKHAHQLAHNASSVAQKGGAVVSEVVATMNGIDDSSRKIVEIISVIDGIAFQTNILALNASVEAARAGERGRGFAVVAAEVRELAQRSAVAAKEIKVLISDSVEKVGAGSKLVSQAGQTMEEIVVAVKRVNDIMTEISTASAEQGEGIEQINKAVSQIDEATQQNAALVEEASATAELLQDETENLTRSISVFKMNTTGRMVEAQQIISKVAAKSLPSLPVRKPYSAGKSKNVIWNKKTKDSFESEWSEF